MFQIFLMFFIIRDGSIPVNASRCSSLIWHKNTSADYIIAGIFPIHYYSSSKSSFVFNPAGLTWVEAMLLAIQEINNNNDILPNITIGYALYDSCNDASFGLHAALDIIQEPKRIPSFPRRKYVSETPKDAVACFCNKTKPSVIAVIGDAASASSTRIASVLGASEIKMPQISYSSTSTVLSNKKYYPSFLRTIPPDEYQAMFIIDIFKRFKWTYVSFIASDDAYGRLGVENLLPLLENENICVAVSDVFEATESGRTKVRDIVAKLVKDEKAKIIVLWCQYPQAELFLQEAERQKLFDRIWIATETWGSNTLVKRIEKRVVGGLLGIIPAAVEYAPFDDFLASVTPNVSTVNPWLDIYWRQEFNCGSPDNRTYHCNSKLPVNAKSLPRNKFANVMDAVYTVAHALNSAREHASSQVYAESKISPKTLLHYIKSVNFTGKANLRVSFNENGDPDVASYSLTNLQQVSGAEMDFRIVGGWDSKSRQLTFINTTNIMFSNWSLTPPNSTCAEECSPGLYALTFTSKPCCWTCVQCPNNEIQPRFGMKRCIRCQGDEVANEKRTECITPSYTYMKYSSISGIVILGLTAVAVLITIFVMVILMRNWDSPLVKAMNRELTVMQLSSVVVIFCMPLLYMSKPSMKLCGVRPFYFVLFYTISVSVTFTKTDRLLRIFKASTSGRLSRGSRVLNNRVQFLTVFALTLIAGLVCTIFYFVFPPILIKEVERTSSGVVMTFSCGTGFTVLLVILLSYIFAISMTCSIFAFKARKLPENYNEAKYTSFAMFSFCLVWMFFLPLYFSTNAATERDLIFLVVSFLSTLARLAILYGPKLAVILLHPEENTVERFRAKLKTQRSNRSSGASPSQHAPINSNTNDIVRIPSSTQRQSPARNLAFEISVDQKQPDIEI